MSSQVVDRRCGLKESRGRIEAQKVTMLWTCEKGDGGLRMVEEMEIRTRKKTSWKTKKNMERDIAAGYGRVKNRGGISNGSNKMEKDHCKSNPKHGRRWTINEVEEDDDNESDYTF